MGPCAKLAEFAKRSGGLRTMSKSIAGFDQHIKNLAQHFLAHPEEVGAKPLRPGAVVDL
jgi:hypothetical protein